MWSVKILFLFVLENKKLLLGCIFVFIWIFVFVKYFRIFFVLLGIIIGILWLSLKNMKIISDINYIWFYGLYWIMIEYNYNYFLGYLRNNLD